MRSAAGQIAAACLVVLTTASAQADVSVALDQCLVDPAKTKAVFIERFPHERCDIASECDPNLVQSAATLARGRCRREAIDACATPPSDVDCTTTLTDRWEGMALSIKTDVQSRWVRLDRSKVSPFAIRRFDTRSNFDFSQNCADLENLYALSDLPDETVCALFASFKNVSRMEGLSNYLADQEARQ